MTDYLRRRDIKEMARIIDADRLKDSIKKLEAESPDIKTARIIDRTIQEIFPQIIDDEPTIDPRDLIIKSRWEECDYKTFEHGGIETHYGKGIYCPICRCGFKKSELKTRNFCPSCGARMRGDADEEP